MKSNSHFLVHQNTCSRRILGALAWTLSLTLIFYSVTPVSFSYADTLGSDPQNQQPTIDPDNVVIEPDGSQGTTPSTLGPENPLGPSNDGTNDRNAHFRESAKTNFVRVGYEEDCGGSTSPFAQCTYTLVGHITGPRPAIGAPDQETQLVITDRFGTRRELNMSHFEEDGTFRVNVGTHRNNKKETFNITMHEVESGRGFYTGNMVINPGHGQWGSRLMTNNPEDSVYINELMYADQAGSTLEDRKIVVKGRIDGWDQVNSDQYVVKLRDPLGEWDESFIEIINADGTFEFEYEPTSRIYRGELEFNRIQIYMGKKKNPWSNEIEWGLTSEITPHADITSRLPDEQLPDVAILSPAEDAEVSSRISIVTHAEDSGGIAEVQVLLNGELLGTVTQPSPDGKYRLDWDTLAREADQSRTYPDGDYEIMVRVLDSAGNIETDTVQFRVDNTEAVRPAAEIKSPGMNQQLRETVSVEVEATDDLNVDYVELLLDGVVFATTSTTNAQGDYVYNWDTKEMDADGRQLFQNGDFTLTAVAVDVEGNRSVITANQNEIPISINNPDRIGPRILNVSPPNGAVVSGETWLEIEAIDNYGIEEAYFVYNGIHITPIDTEHVAGTDVWRILWDTEALHGNGTRMYPEGQITLQAKVMDTSRATATQDLTLFIDNRDLLQPNVSIESPAEGEIVSGEVEIVVDASDDTAIDVVEVYLGDQLLGTAELSNGKYRYTWDTLALDERGKLIAQNGDAVLRVRAIDVAENFRDAEVNVTVFNQDSADPVIDSISPTHDSVVNRVVNIDVEASDDLEIALVRFMINGSLVGMATELEDGVYRHVWDTNEGAGQYPDGDYTITVEVTDTAGNRVIEDVAVYVENKFNDIDLAAIIDRAEEIKANPSNYSDADIRGAYEGLALGLEYALVSRTLETLDSNSLNNVRALRMPLLNAVQNYPFENVVDSQLIRRAYEALKPYLIHGGQNPQIVNVGSDIGLKSHEIMITNYLGQLDEVTDVEMIQSLFSFFRNDKVINYPLNLDSIAHYQFINDDVAQLDLGFIPAALHALYDELASRPAVSIARQAAVEEWALTWDVQTVNTVNTGRETIFGLLMTNELWNAFGGLLASDPVAIDAVVERRVLHKNGPEETLYRDYGILLQTGMSRALQQQILDWVSAFAEGQRIPMVITRSDLADKKDGIHFYSIDSSEQLNLMIIGADVLASSTMLEDQLLPELSRIYGTDPDLTAPVISDVPTEPFLVNQQSGTLLVDVLVDGEPTTLEVDYELPSMVNDTYEKPFTVTDAAGNESEPAIIYITLDTYAPSEIEHHFSDLGTDQMTLHFEVSELAEVVSVEYADNWDFTDAVTLVPSDPMSTVFSYQLENLEPGKNYYARVTVRDKVGNEVVLGGHSWNEGTYREASITVDRINRPDDSSVDIHFTSSLSDGNAAWRDVEYRLISPTNAFETMTVTSPYTHQDVFKLENLEAGQSYDYVIEAWIGNVQIGNHEGQFNTRSSLALTASANTTLHTASIEATVNNLSDGDFVEIMLDETGHTWVAMDCEGSQCVYLFDNLASDTDFEYSIRVISALGEEMLKDDFDFTTIANDHDPIISLIHNLEAFDVDPETEGIQVYEDVLPNLVVNADVSDEDGSPLYFQWGESIDNRQIDWVLTGTMDEFTPFSTLPYPNAGHFKDIILKIREHDPLERVQREAIASVRIHTIANPDGIIPEIDPNVTPPLIEIHSPTLDQRIEGEVEILFTVNDDEGPIQELRLEIQDDTDRVARVWELDAAEDDHRVLWNTLEDFPDLADGEYRFVVHAIDEYGNVTTAEVTALIDNVRDVEVSHYAYEYDNQVFVDLRGEMNNYNEHIDTIRITTAEGVFELNECYPGNRACKGEIIIGRNNFNKILAIDLDQPEVVIELIRSHHVVDRRTIRVEKDWPTINSYRAVDEEGTSGSILFDFNLSDFDADRFNAQICMGGLGCQDVDIDADGNGSGRWDNLKTGPRAVYLRISYKERPDPLQLYVNSAVINVHIDAPHIPQDSLDYHFEGEDLVITGDLEGWPSTGHPHNFRIAYQTPLGEGYSTDGAGNRMTLLGNKFEIRFPNAINSARSVHFPAGAGGFRVWIEKLSEDFALQNRGPVEVTMQIWEDESHPDGVLTTTDFNEDAYSHAERLRRPDFVTVDISYNSDTEELTISGVIDMPRENLPNEHAILYTGELGTCDSHGIIPCKSNRRGISHNPRVTWNGQHFSVTFQDPFYNNFADEHGDQYRLDPALGLDVGLRLVPVVRNGWHKLGGELRLQVDRPPHTLDITNIHEGQVIDGEYEIDTEVLATIDSSRDIAYVAYHVKSLEGPREGQSWHLGSVTAEEAVNGRYKFNWDPSSLPEGKYAVYALAFHRVPGTSNIEQLGGDVVEVNVERPEVGEEPPASETPLPEINNLVRTVAGTGVLFQFETPEESRITVSYSEHPGLKNATTVFGDYGTDHTISIEGLDPGKTYYYHIIAVDRVPKVIFSSVQKFTTPDDGTSLDDLPEHNSQDGDREPPVDEPPVDEPPIDEPPANEPPVVHRSEILDSDMDPSRPGFQFLSGTNVRFEFEVSDPDGDVNQLSYQMLAQINGEVDAEGEPVYTLLSGPNFLPLNANAEGVARINQILDQCDVDYCSYQIKLVVQDAEPAQVEYILPDHQLIETRIAPEAPVVTIFSIDNVTDDDAHVNVAITGIANGFNPPPQTQLKLKLYDVELNQFVREYDPFGLGNPILRDGEYQFRLNSLDSGTEYRVVVTAVQTVNSHITVESDPVEATFTTAGEKVDILGVEPIKMRLVGESADPRREVPVIKTGDGTYIQVDTENIPEWIELYGRVILTLRINDGIYHQELTAEDLIDFTGRIEFLVPDLITNYVYDMSVTAAIIGPDGLVNRATRLQPVLQRRVRVTQSSLAIDLENAIISEGSFIKAFPRVLNADGLSGRIKMDVLGANLQVTASITYEFSGSGQEEFDVPVESEAYSMLLRHGTFLRYPYIRFTVETNDGQSAISERMEVGNIVTREPVLNYRALQSANDIVGNRLIVEGEVSSYDPARHDIYIKAVRKFSRPPEILGYYKIPAGAFNTGRSDEFRYILDTREDGVVGVNAGLANADLYLVSFWKGRRPNPSLRNFLTPETAPLELFGVPGRRTARPIPPPVPEPDPQPEPEPQPDPEPEPQLNCKLTPNHPLCQKEKESNIGGGDQFCPEGSNDPRCTKGIPTPSGRTAVTHFSYRGTPTRGMASINVSTPQPVFSRIEYGTTQSLGRATAPSRQASRSVSHRLPGVSSSMPLFYRVLTWDNQGNASVSEIQRAQTGQTINLILRPLLD